MTDHCCRIKRAADLGRKLPMLATSAQWASRLGRALLVEIGATFLGLLNVQLLRVLHDKINMFELVVGEMDAILGTLDDSLSAAAASTRGSSFAPRSPAR